MTHVASSISSSMTTILETIAIMLEVRVAVMAKDTLKHYVPRHHVRWNSSVKYSDFYDVQVNEKFFELKGTYRDCRKSTGNKFGY